MSRTIQAASPEGMRRSATLLTVLVVLAGGILLTDATAPTSAGGPDPAEPVRGTTSVAYCPVAAGEDERTSVTVAAAGDGPADVVLQMHTGGDATEVVGEFALDAGQRESVNLPSGQPVSVHAVGGDIVGTWSVAGDRAATGPCADEPADTFYLAGLDTTLGSDASLHLFNPFSVDAVVRLRYGTAEGAAELVSTENVAVPAGTTETVDLTELQPEQPGLAVVVETLAGRVIAQGEMERTPIDDADEGPTGRTIVPAATEMSATATFASAASSDGWLSTLAIYNPSDRQAAVRIHTTEPNPETPVEEVSVPAGGVTTVSMEGRSEADAFAVWVESLTELPILVTRTDRKAGESAGIAASVGAPEPAERWVIPGSSGERVEIVSVYNPGEEPVSVTASFAGVPVGRWNPRTVLPGERQIVRIVDVPGASWPARVDAEGPVVVEMVSIVEAAADAARLVGLATPLPLREPTAAVPPVRVDPSLSVTPVAPVQLPGDD